jgi:hypothetical protein
MSPLPWSEPVRLSEVGRGPHDRKLTADAAARIRIATALDLVDLPELAAEVQLAPWMDGAIVHASWRARVVQTCGVTLEPLESELSGEFDVRAVPQGSVAAPAEAGALELDLDAPDPPDILDGDRIDPAAYVVEHLALALDPFPRKPGAVFQPPEATPEASLFAVLLELKPRT